MYYQSRFKKLVIGILILWLFVVHQVAFAATMPTDIPAYINYEGRLTKSSDGIPVSERLTMTFSIYDTTEPAEDSSLYKQTESVALENGLFSVVLGEIPVEVFTGHNQLYIGVKINDNPEMRPLQRITSAAYAYKAEVARTAEVAKTAENVMGQVNVDPSTGNVGIGTTSPNQVLHVAGNARIQAGDIYLGSGLSGSATDMRISYSSNDALGFVVGAGGEKMRISNNGNVGIGTTEPKAKLDITAGDIILDNGYGVMLEGTGGGNNRILWSDSSNIVRLQNQHDDLRLGAAGADVMTIKSGNVGIGTTGPIGRLHIQNGSAEGATPYLGSTTVLSLEASGSNALSFLNTNNSEAFIFFGDTDSATAGYVSYNHIRDQMYFKTTGTYSFNSGNVGIGTTSPQVPLHIIGSMDAPSSSGTPNGSLILGGTGTEVQMAMGVTANVTPQYGWIQPRYSNNTNVYNLVLNPNSGNVGIGTTSPAQKLHVSGASRIDGHLYFNAGSRIDLGTTDNQDLAIITSNTEAVRVKNNGNVGIGTTAPNYPLHVAGNIYSTSGVIATTLWSSDSIRKLNAASPLYFRNSAGAAEMILDGTGNVGIGTTEPNQLLHVAGNARIQAGDIYLGSGLAGSATDMRLSYSSNDALGFVVGAGGERMRISNNGNLCIGTTSPEVLTGYSAPWLQIQSTAPGIFLKDSDTTSGYRNMYIGAKDGVFRLGRASDDGSSITANYMTINGSGNVGIGTEIPDAKLHVNGNVKVDGTLEATSFKGSLSGSVSWSNITGIPDGFKDNVDNVDDAVSNPSGTYSNMTVGNATSATSAGYATSAGNADTVDSKHASDFASSGHKHYTIRYTSECTSLTESQLWDPGCPDGYVLKRVYRLCGEGECGSGTGGICCKITIE